MCDDGEALLAHAEVLVLASTSGEAADVLAAARPDQLVVDLTRGAVRGRLPAAGRA
jgi:hypothetical protein